MSFDPNAPAGEDSGVFGLPHSVAEAGVVLIPVPFEATTSYGSGTAQGPAAILAASRQVDLFDRETGRPYEAGIAMLDVDEQVARWNEEGAAAAGRVRDGATRLRDGTDRDREIVNDRCDRVNSWLVETAASLIAQGKRVGTIGGDHGSVFGALQAHAAKYPGMGVLHVDAHADLRHEYEGFAFSHASIMDCVAGRIPQVAKLVQVGIRDFCEEELEQIEASRGRIVTFFDADLAAERCSGATWAAQVNRIVETLPGQVYVSFDIDGLDPVLCPHTGTPVPGGLSFHEASFLLARVAQSGRTIVGFDLAEVAPGPDSEWDANVGARLLYKLIGYMLLSQRPSKRPR